MRLWSKIMSLSCLPSMYAFRFHNDPVYLWNDPLFFVLMGPWTPRCKVLVRTLKHFTWIGLKVFFGFGADMLHNMRSDICFLKKKSSDNSMKVIFHNNKEFGKHFMYNSNKTKKQILAGPKKKTLLQLFHCQVK